MQPRIAIMAGGVYNGEKAGVRPLEGSKPMKHSRALRARNWLLFWTLFIGLGAVTGRRRCCWTPSGKTLGMDAMLPYFQVLPFAETVFQDFTFSGWALLLVNGLTNLTAAGLLLREKPAGVILGGFSASR